MATHGLIVSFELAEMHMPAKSTEAGRPIYDMVEYVNILIPGDRNTEIIRVATDADREKYPEEYARFKNAAKEATSGTPLSHWTLMPASVAKEWAYFNVFSVENLAGLSDTGKQAFGPGAEDWARKAKAHLEAAKNEGFVQMASQENANLRAEIAELKEQIRELASAQQRRGPGRPPKAEEAAQ